MNRVFLTAISLFIFTSFMSLNAQWARTYGGEKDDRPFSIQQTSDGGYVVAGETSSFGAGGFDFWKLWYDFWILKLDLAGEIEWQRTYGGGNDDVAYSIQQTSDGGFIVAGKTNSFGAGSDDFWILKLDSTGAIEWQRTYGGGTSNVAYSIQQTSDGGYVVAGETLSFGAGSYDFWILKLDLAGEIEWQRTYGGGTVDCAYSIQQTSDGGYVVAGETLSFGAGSDDFWILKLDSTGAIEWQRTYGGGNDDVAYSIQQTSDGGYVVAGETSSFGAGGFDFWILKLDLAGEIEWQSTYGGSEDERAQSIQQTNDGGYIVAGRTGFFTDIFGDNSGDFWVLKLSSDGKTEWQKNYGGDYSPDRAKCIQQIDDGGYIVAGSTESWGSGSSAGWIGFDWEDGFDILVLELSPDGNINSRCAFIRGSNAEVSNTYIAPEDTNVTPEDTNIAPEDSNITSQESDANVYKLCVSSTYYLNLSISDGGTTDPAPGAYAYDIGTEVTLKAIPHDGFRFSYWSGNVRCKENPMTLKIDGDKSIKANFKKKGGIKDRFVGIQTPLCFIATAAYGSPLHPCVKVLRDFRDTYLMPSNPGRALVNLYYKYSPFVANIIAKHKVLKVAVRFSLLPVIVFSYSMVHLGPIITAIMLVLIFMLPIFLISFFQRKLSQARPQTPKALASLG